MRKANNRPTRMDVRICGTSTWKNVRSGPAPINVATDSSVGSVCRIPALMEMNMNGMTKVLCVMTRPNVELSRRTPEKKM
ncbi:hypothetical protein D3C72_1830110 [compost metagenome]